MLLSAITAAVLSACGGGGNCADCVVPAGQLIFVAPSIIPSLANTTGINYMAVYNPSTAAISGISYGLGQQVGSGNSITLDSASAANCASIAAQSSCFLKLSVPAGTIAGGAVVTATNSSGSEAATPLAIGVQQVAYTESANADGVGLYFYPKAQYSESGASFILVTAVVQSPNVGNINTIELVDENGNVIPNQVVNSGNSGPGKSLLQMGDVVEISVPLPQGANLTQNMKVQTSYQTLTSSVINSIANKLSLKSSALNSAINTSTGTTIYSLQTQSNNINLQFTPNQVYLTETNPIQYGYLYNIGDLTASQIQISSSSPNVRVTAANDILNGQRVIKVTYELIDTSVASTSTTVTVTAQNPSGQIQTSTGETNQNVNPDVVPTPTPLWTVLNGSSSDTNSFSRVYGIAVDNLGSSIAVGLTNGSLYGGSSNQSRQYFIAKYDTSGSLVWGHEVTTGVTTASITGGGAAANVTATAVNLNQTTDAIYVVGNTEGALSGGTKVSTSNVPDYFITKYSSSGNILWSVQKGEAGTVKGSYGLGVSSSSDGSSVYIVGDTYQNLSGSRLTVPTSPDYFLSKYDNLGNLIWLIESGTSDPSKKTYSTGVNVDNENNIIITGYTTGTLSCPGGVASGFVGNGLQNGFAAKYSNTGQCIWVRQLGDTSSNTLGEVAAFSVTTDNSNNVYITGNTNGLVSGSSIKYGLEDAFVSKLDINGNIIWTTQIGATGQEYSTNTIAYSNTTNMLYIGGSGGINNYSYIAKLDTSGNLINSYTQVNATADNSINALGLDPFGNIYSGGVTEGSMNNQSYIGTGGQNLFVMKFNF